MTLEEQYKQETGDNFTGVMDVHEFYRRYRLWLETRLTLALSRIEAADRYIEYFNLETIPGFEGAALAREKELYHEYKAAIRAMEGEKPKPISDNPPKPWTPPEFLPPPPDGKE